MDNLSIDIKFKIVSWIFTPYTINYLKNNGYDFKPNLHKYTLKSLIDGEDDFFEDLIVNGLYDDNYFWVHKFEYKENKKKHYNCKDLLFMMVDKNIRGEKYFRGLIKSNKKNVNLIDKKNNTIALYHYIYKFYPENIICDLIGNHELHNIDIISSTKKGSKCLELCWKKKHDLLLIKILQTTNTIKINNFLINKINTYEYEYIKDNFPKSIPYIYKLACVSTQKVTSSNVIFYLNVTKLYFPKDYEKVLRSKYLYYLILNKLYIIAMYILASTNTDISNEIFDKIDCNNGNNDELINSKYSKFYDDILLIGLIKSYEIMVYGTFKDDLLPIVLNTIISHYKLEIEYKDIDDFKKKIKSIIPKLNNINLNNCKEELITRVIENCNEQYAIKIFDRIYFDGIHNKIINSNIIYLCLDNNFDNLICHLIIKNRIDLLKLEVYWNKKNDYADTFFELLVKKNKNILIMKIINNDLITQKISRSKMVFAGLCLSIVHNKIELFVEFIENYNHFIQINKLFETFYYSKNCSDSIIYNMIKNKMDNYLDWILNKYFLSESTQINCKICNESGDSIISLLIEYDYIKYIEKIINKLGKDIFKHIPMFTLNSVNLSYSPQLSNGKELYWACKKNLNNIAWFFVSNKLGYINYFDSDGNSVLILACKNNMNTVAGNLLNLDLIEWERKNNLGKTCLDYAKENNMIQIIQIIEAKIKKQNKLSNQNLSSNKYNCEINKKIFENKEITVENIGDFAKIFDILQNINKKK